MPGNAVVRITTSEKYMDRVNMYASFYVGIRQGGPSIEEKLAQAQPDSPNSVLQTAISL